MLKIIRILSCWKEVVCFEYALFVEYAILCEMADCMMLLVAMVTWIEIIHL